MYKYKKTSEENSLAEYMIYHPKGEHKILPVGIVRIELIDQKLLMNFRLDEENQSYPRDQSVIAVVIESLQQLGTFLQDLNTGLIFTLYNNIPSNYRLGYRLEITNGLWVSMDSTDFKIATYSQEDNDKLISVREYISNTPIRKLLYDEGWLVFLR